MILVRRVVSIGLFILATVALVFYFSLGILDLIKYIQAGFPNGGTDIVMATLSALVHGMLALLIAAIFAAPAAFIYPLNVQKRKNDDWDDTGSLDTVAELMYGLREMSVEELTELVRDLPASHPKAQGAITELLDREVDLRSELIELYRQKYELYG